MRKCIIQVRIKGPIGAFGMLFAFVKVLTMEGGNFLSQVSDPKSAGRQLCSDILSISFYSPE